MLEITFENNNYSVIEGEELPLIRLQFQETQKQFTVTLRVDSLSAARDVLDVDSFFNTSNVSEATAGNAYTVWQHSLYIQSQY